MINKSAQTTTETIRSVQRALLVLRVLNERERWSLQDLQARTGLPKSTLHRLLLTLQVEHYVYSGEETYGEYRLTQDVSNLSRGVTVKNRLADVARPIVISVTKTIKWPMAVGVIDGAAVRVNVCTMPYSPYSMRPTCMGQRYDLLTTALGNAYLAFCDAAERRILIDMLDDHGTVDRRYTAAGLHRILAGARRQGYGLRMGRRSEESTALAVPIFDTKAQLIGVMGCSTYSRSGTTAWVERNFPIMRQTADEIGSQFD